MPSGRTKTSVASGSVRGAARKNSRISLRARTRSQIARCAASVRSVGGSASGPSRSLSSPSSQGHLTRRAHPPLRHRGDRWRREVARGLRVRADTRRPLHPLHTVHARVHLRSRSRSHLRSHAPVRDIRLPHARPSLRHRSRAALAGCPPPVPLAPVATPPFLLMSLRPSLPASSPLPRDAALLLILHRLVPLPLR